MPLRSEYISTMSLSDRYAMSTLLIMLTYLHLMFSSPICSTNGYNYPRPQSKLFLPGPQYCPETGRTVCKDVDYYPEERIYLILSKTKAQGFNLSSVFFDEREGDAQPNMAQLPNWPPQASHQPTSVHHDYIVPEYSTWSKSHSIGKRNEDTEQACASRTIFIPPRAALNDKSQWKYVVNLSNQNFRQIVRVEICAFSGRACSSQISVPFGYVSRCVQKHIKKKLLSLDPDGQTTSEDSFFIPSCCVCQLVRNFGT